jgi:hypothetical protein
LSQYQNKKRSSKAIPLVDNSNEKIDLKNTARKNTDLSNIEEEKDSTQKSSVSGFSPRKHQEEVRKLNSSTAYNIF